jgi:hypothetical protein
MVAWKNCISTAVSGGRKLQYACAVCTCAWTSLSPWSNIMHSCVRTATAVAVGWLAQCLWSRDMDDPSGVARRTGHMPAWNAQFASPSTTLSTAAATVMQYSLNLCWILLDQPVKAEPQVSNCEAEFGSVCAAWCRVRVLVLVVGNRVLSCLC